MSRLVEIEGKKVVDASYGMSVNVTPQDVAKGKRKDAHSCAIALACVRELDAVSAVVNRTRTYVEYPKRWLRFITPPKVRDELAAFDTTGQFHPGRYVLYAPTKSIKIGVPVNRTPATKRQKRKPRKVEKGVRSMSTMHKMFNKKDD